MKFETYLLHGLFVACFAVCALVMGAMLTAKPTSANIAGNSVASVLLTAPTSCAMRPDGVICPIQHG